MHDRPATAPSLPSAGEVRTRVRRGWPLQYRTPRGGEWNRYDLPVPGLPGGLEGLRIVHLTDTHFKGFWSSDYEALQAEINAAGADLILFTGDLVDNKRDCRPAIPHARRFFGGLTAKLGIYGVLGNHDGYLVAPYLAEMNVDHITHQRRTIARRGAAIELIGLAGVERDDVREELLYGLPPKGEDAVRIVLCHFPDMVRVAGPVLRPDLFLAGHTHGGQICAPWGWPPITHDALPKAQSKGLHRVGETWMHVGRGLGFSALPFRAFASTEVAEIVLRRA